MKKIILLPICFAVILFSKIAGATEGAMIFNMSKRYDMHVIYRICEHYYKICTEEREIIISAKKDAQSKNYYNFLPDSKSENDPLNEMAVIVSSALEKDENGNIISQSNYVRTDYPARFGSCIVPFLNIKMGHGFALILNDMNESPYIVCQSDSGTFF